MEPGEQFVMTPGILMMRESFAVRLVILMLSVPASPLTSVKEVERYGWMMSTVMVMRVPLRVARTVVGIYIIAVTVKMHQLSVHVSTTTI